MKWYIYKCYNTDIYIPLYWEDCILEFNTEDAAWEFLEAAKQELGFNINGVVVKSEVYFKTKDETINATYLRVRAASEKVREHLYDIRRE